jgi:hypothetical protein
MNIPKIHSFPKIFHIGERFIENLFRGEVEITEKIDGSQFDFGMDTNREIVCRSKGEDLTYKDTPAMFTLAIEQLKRMTPVIEELEQEIYFYAEFLSKPSHNVLKYKKVPKNNLYLFGVQIGQIFVSDLNTICKYADLLEIERPNLIFKGEIKEVKDLETLLDNNSILGNEKIEGIVVKNYNEPSVIGNMIIPLSMGKYVREDFKERHATEWNTHFTSKGRLTTLIDSYKSEARWQKAVQHLREKNQLENSPKDIGKLMIEIKKDLLEEETENIKNELFKVYQNDIERTATRRFPEWYKEQLLKSAIDNTSEKS